MTLEIPKIPSDATEAQALRAVRTMLTDPEHWTQNMLARDDDGNPEFPTSKHARSFCLIGAGVVIADANDFSNMDYYLRHGKLLQVVQERKTPEMIVAAIKRNRMVGGFRERDLETVPTYIFNNMVTHGELMDALDETIRRLEPNW